MESISLKDIIEKLLFKKWFILITVVSFFILGVLCASLTEKEYTASLKILPENQQASSGLLSQLGNIPGFNFGNQIMQDNVLPTAIYPEIIQSNNFYLSLLNKELMYNGDTMIVRDYVSTVYSLSVLELVKKYTSGLPGLFRKSQQRGNSSKTVDGITYLGGDDAKYKSWFSRRISIGTDNSTKILTIGVELPDQLVAAQLANFTAEYLRSYLDDYQTQNAVRHLNFIEDRRDEAKKDYLKAQKELAVFRDRNRNVFSEVSRTREEVLVQEFNLTNRIYSSLAEQYEQANIKAKEKRVLFQILEQVQLPAPSTKPQTVLIIIISLFTGIIFSVLYVLFPVIFKEFYE